MAKIGGENGGCGGSQWGGWGDMPKKIVEWEKYIKYNKQHTCVLIIYTPFREESPRSRVVKKNPDLAHIREG